MPSLPFNPDSWMFDSARSWHRICPDESACLAAAFRRARPDRDDGLRETRAAIDRRATAGGRGTPSLRDQLLILPQRQSQPGWIAGTRYRGIATRAGGGPGAPSGLPARLQAQASDSPNASVAVALAGNRRSDRVSRRRAKSAEIAPKNCARGAAMICAKAGAQTFSNSVRIWVGRATVCVTGEPSIAACHSSRRTFSSASARTKHLALIVG